MTNAQRFCFYFPAFNACSKANGWHTENKAVVMPETGPCHSAPEFAQVHTFARQRAITECRVMTLDDLRHGCHWLMLGRDKPSEVLTNADLDRVVCLFHVLADPIFLGTDRKSGRLDLDAYLRGEDPGQVRRLHHVINSVPEALARSIAADMIHTRDWESASVSAKLILSRRLAQYRDAKKKPLTEANKGNKAAAPQPSTSVPFVPFCSKPVSDGSYQLNPHKVFTPKPKPAAVLQAAGSDPDWNVQ